MLHILGICYKTADSRNSELAKIGNLQYPIFVVHCLYVNWVEITVLLDTTYINT